MVVGGLQSIMIAQDQVECFTAEDNVDDVDLHKHN